MEILKDGILAQIVVFEQDTPIETKISRCVLLVSHLLIKERIYNIRDKIKNIHINFVFVLLR